MEGDREDRKWTEELEVSYKHWRTSPRGGPGERVFCKQNCLIDTHRVGAEPTEALVSAYTIPYCQGHEGLKEHSGPPQLLNPGALLPHQAASDPSFRPASGLLLCREGLLQMWGEAGGGDCCETTFIEGHGHDTTNSATCSPKEVLLYADAKFLEFSGEGAIIPSLSYDIDDDDDFQELEVRSKLSFHETINTFFLWGGVGGWGGLKPGVSDSLLERQPVNLKTVY